MRVRCKWRYALTLAGQKGRVYALGGISAARQTYERWRNLSPPAGAIAACAAPLVGLMAERLFGFSGSGTGAPAAPLPASASPPLCAMCAPRMHCKQLPATAAAVSHDRARDLANARALGNALLAFLVGPWTLTLALYTGGQGCRQGASAVASFATPRGGCGRGVEQLI